MTGCAEPGSRIWLSHSSNLKRKYPYTWELSETASGDMICIHSARANGLVEEAIRAGKISVLPATFAELAREVRYGKEGSRADFLLSYHGPAEQQACYVEVKSVTLDCGAGLGSFPDTVSQRGTRHLRELMDVKRQGDCAVLLFCVMHTGIDRFMPADVIDPLYGAILREAFDAGVEVLAYRANISCNEITLEKEISVLF